MTASNSSIIADTMNHHSVDSQLFLSAGNPLSPPHLHSHHHTATAPTATTMPVVYHHPHQQPSLIQVGGSILMPHAATASTPSQSQQVVSFSIPSTHNNARSGASGSTESIFISQPQPQPQIQQRYQQPLVLQQPHGLTLMNPGNSSLCSTSSAHMYDDSTRNN